MLGGAELVEVSSDGEPGDKARFVRGVERALLDGEAEIGVHSAKDLPAELPDGLTIGAVPAREDPRRRLDRRRRLARRRARGRQGRDRQPAPARPAARRPARPRACGELHGNVDTRLRKLAEGELDAIVLAVAGLRRLGRESEISFAIPAESMTPAAGQGSLVLQIRAERRGDRRGRRAALGDETALRELTAERTVVSLLDATCATPIGVHARVDAEAMERSTPSSACPTAASGSATGSRATRDGAGPPRRRAGPAPARHRRPRDPRPGGEVERRTCLSLGVLYAPLAQTPP